MASKTFGNFTFNETSIKDVYIIDVKKYGDNRGYFMETYKEADFKAAGLDYNFVQDNQSKSKAGVLRGLHFQKTFPQAKLVRCLEGEVFDVAVDLRAGSPTYGKWEAQCESKALLAAVAEAHVSLCKGQGMELDWSKSPRPFTLDFVMDIFCNKTVPAFEVSLMLGLICAGNDEELREVFHAYSKALGIAYQLKDDIEDFDNEAPVEIRPSAVLALVCEQHPDAGFLHRMFSAKNLKEFFREPDNQPILQQAIEKARLLAEDYHQQALAALYNVKHVELKRLLFRVTERIIG